MMFPLVIGILSAIKNGSFTPINPVSLFDASSVGEYFNSASTGKIEDASGNEISDGAEVGYWQGDRSEHVLNVGIGGNPSTFPQYWHDNNVDSDTTDTGYVFGCSTFSIDAATTPLTWGGCFGFSGIVYSTTIDLIWPMQGGGHKGGTYYKQDGSIRFDPTGESADEYGHGVILDDGKPHTVFQSYDPSEDLIKSWVDGVVVNTEVPVGVVESCNGIYAGLGRTDSINNRYIQKLFAIDKALSDAEGADLHAAMLADARVNGSDPYPILIPSKTVKTGLLSSVDVDLGDPIKGDGLTYSLDTDAYSLGLYNLTGSASFSGNTLTYTPDVDGVAEDGVVLIKATDGTDTSNTASIRIKRSFSTFHDTFSSASPEDLANHTPESGGIWEVDDNNGAGTAIVDGGSVTMQSNLGSANPAKPVPDTKVIKFTIDPSTTASFRLWVRGTNASADAVGILYQPLNGGRFRWITREASVNTTGSNNDHLITGNEVFELVDNGEDMMLYVDGGLLVNLSNTPLGQGDSQANIQPLGSSNVVVLKEFQVVDGDTISSSFD